MVGHARKGIGSHASRRVPLLSPRRSPRARERPLESVEGGALSKVRRAPGSKIKDYSSISIPPYCCEGNTMHFGPSCDGLRILRCLSLSGSTKNEIALKNVRQVDVVAKPFALQRIDW